MEKLHETKLGFRLLGMEWEGGQTKGKEKNH